MRKRWIWIGGGVVVLGLLVVGNLGRRSKEGFAVKAESLGRRALASWVRAPGTVRAVTQVKVSSNVPGRVEKLHVKEGQWVRKGEPLLDLDDTRYRSAVLQYEAQLAAARSRLAQYEAECQLAETVLKRQRKLLEQELISPEAFQESQTQFEVKKASCEAQARELERLEAALRSARKDLEETHLVAPVSGLVTRIFVEEGENVVTGTMNNPGTVILEIADLSEMEVEAEVDETDVIRVRPGQRARIEVDALPDTVLTGTVSRVGQAGKTSQEGADFLVRVRIDDPPDVLRPGMSADVEILVASADSALALPIQALTARPKSRVDAWLGRDTTRVDEASSSEEDWLSTGGGGEAFVEGVFVVQADTVVFRPVEVGIRGEAHLEVLSGLQEGEKVVTGPYRILRRLKPGDRVRVEGREAKDEETTS
jgi:HlyD family secretion protein